MYNSSKNRLRLDWKDKSVISLCGLLLIAAVVAAAYGIATAPRWVQGLTVGALLFMAFSLLARRLD